MPKWRPLQKARVWWLLLKDWKNVHWTWKFGWVWEIVQWPIHRHVQIPSPEKSGTRSPTVRSGVKARDRKMLMNATRFLLDQPIDSFARHSGHFDLRRLPAVIMDTEESAPGDALTTVDEHGIQLDATARARLTDMMRLQPFAIFVNWLQNSTADAGENMLERWLSAHLPDSKLHQKLKKELEASRDIQEERARGGVVEALIPIPGTRKLQKRFRHPCRFYAHHLYLAIDPNRPWYAHRLIGSDDGFYWSLPGDRLMSWSSIVQLNAMTSWAISNQTAWRVSLQEGDNRGFKVQFCMNNGALLEFFKHRAKQTGEKRRSPLAHYVAAHDRANGSHVSAHYRGKRAFEWGGLKGTIQSPVWDDRYIAKGLTPDEIPTAEKVEQIFEVDADERKEFAQNAVQQIMKMRSLERNMENKNTYRAFQLTRR